MAFGMITLRCRRGGRVIFTWETAPSFAQDLPGFGVPGQAAAEDGVGRWREHTLGDLGAVT